MVKSVGFKNIESLLETLKKVLEKWLHVFMSFIKNIQALHKQVEFWFLEESHQPTIPIDSISPHV